MQNGREYITSISEQPIGSSKKLNSFQLPAGDYEFPFSIPLSGQMLETITGLQHSYHTYHVQAIIERRFRSNSIISRDLRIYQSPDPWADHQMSFISTVRSLSQASMDSSNRSLHPYRPSKGNQTKKSNTASQFPTLISPSEANSP